MDAALLATLIVVSGAILLLVIHVIPFGRQRRSWEISSRLRWESDDGFGESEQPRVFAPAPDRRRFWVQVFVTVVVLLEAIYVLVFKPDAETSLKDFCCTSVGTLLGFWLKG